MRAKNERSEEPMSTIEKSIEVNVPEYTAYAQWTRFEEFPLFMEGVKEVKRNGKRLHWQAEIAGQDKEWDAEIIEETADQRIAWRSQDGAIPGWVVTFHHLSNASSKVMVQLEYAQGLGVVSSNVQGDLERFKMLVEKRWRPAGGETIFDIAVGKTY
jgi:uncharacterized membrane protein